jgi:hypothetical protein
MDPTLALGAPMNILPPAAQTAASPLGVLNGQQPPQQQGQGNASLLQQAQALMKGQQQQSPQLQPIQMAKPLGSQGIDPVKLLQAMQQNKLMNA